MSSKSQDVYENMTPFEIKYDRTLDWMLRMVVDHIHQIYGMHIAYTNTYTTAPYYCDDPQDRIKLLENLKRLYIDIIDEHIAKERCQHTVDTIVDWI